MSVPMSAPLEFFLDHHPPTAQIHQDTIAGLERTPKRLMSKYLYDETGSRLFKEICQAPEYYITPTELSILRSHAAELRAHIGPGATIIEFGCGDKAKAQLLLSNLAAPRCYVAIDISRTALLETCHGIRDHFETLPVGAICADFCQPVPLPDDLAQQEGKTGFFPGSTVGNFDPPETLSLLRSFHETLRPRGHLLIGVDLKKDIPTMEAAYDDAGGVTAAFTLNILTRLKRELGLQVAVEKFAYHAAYNEALGRVEMHLRALEDQTLILGERRFPIRKGESLHTESSHKYSVADFQQLAQNAGFVPKTVWRDENQLFSLHWLATDA